MAKKARENSGDSPNPNNVPNRDIIQRLNFLYQASNFYNTLATETDCSSSSATKESKIILEGAQGDSEPKRASGSSAGSREDCGKKKRRRQQITTQTLSRTLVASMKVIGQKTNVRMDPTVKRTICKGCNSLLWPGSTATVRVKALKSHGHAVSYRCNHCQTIRRIPAPPLLEPSNLEEPTMAMAIPQETEGDSDTNTSTTQKDAKRKRNRPRARPPPFFAREGHVVFSGNEVVRYEDT